MKNINGEKQRKSIRARISFKASKRDLHIASVFICHEKKLVTWQRLATKEFGKYSF